MKKVKYLLIMFITMFAFIQNTSALPLKKLMYAGENMKMTEEVDGTMFLAGNSVNAKNTVNGISFIAGNMVDVSSNQDYLFLAGNSITLENTIFKDGFVCGNLININASNITRDLYVAGNVINVNSDIGRNLTVAGSSVTIDSVVNGDLYIDADKIVITKNAKVIGTLKYNENAKVKISKDSVIEKQETYVNSNTKKNLVSKLAAKFESYVNILIVGFILLFIFKSSFKKLEEKEMNLSQILKDLGLGLLILLVIPIICLFIMISIIGTSTSIIISGFYILFIYLSTIFSTYYIANKLLKEKINNNYTILIIGLLVVFILKLIPIISPLVTLFTIFLGLGLITNLIIDYLKSNK